MIGTLVWMSVIPYGATSVRVERLTKGWRLTLGAKVVERRTLVECFEELLGRNAGRDEVSVVVNALTSAMVAAPADTALTRELRSLDLQ